MNAKWINTCIHDGGFQYRYFPMFLCETSEGVTAGWDAASSWGQNLALFCRCKIFAFLKIIYWNMYTYIHIQAGKRQEEIISVHSYINKNIHTYIHTYMYTIYFAQCLLLMSIGGQATWRFKTGFPIIPRSHNSVRCIAVARLGTTTDSLSYTYSYIHTYRKKIILRYVCSKDRKQN